MLDRLISLGLGINPKIAMRVGLVVVGAVAAITLFTCVRENGRATGREEIRVEIETETVKAVENLEKTYEKIDETRADDSGGAAAVERLRDGSFFIGGSGGKAALPAD